MGLRKREMTATWLFVLPALSLFLVFVYYPFLSTLFYSFTDWDGISRPNYVGLENFNRVFTEGALLKAAGNTLYIVFVTMLIGNPIFLLLALALNMPLRTKGIIRTVYYLPQVISLVVIAMIWGAILQYDGVVNTILQQFGLSDLVQDWLFQKGTSLNSIILINTWQTAGFGAIILLAGLQAIPQDLYEAGKIDGATGWKSLQHLTIPLLMPSISVINFLLLVGGLKFFEIPYILTGGGPDNMTMTLALLIYKIAFVYNTMGYATAAGILFMLLITILTLLMLHFTRKREVEY